MNRHSLASTVGIALLASISVCPIARAQWRPEQGHQEAQAQQHAQQQMQQAQQQAQQRQQQAQQQMQQRAQEQMQRQQQAQQQVQQQAQQRAQQDQQRQQQRAQEEQQKQQQRAQQEQQRQMQRAQQDQQRQQQAQQQMQQAQQAQQRAQEQIQRAQQAQQRNMQERAQRDQERQQRDQQRQQRDQQQAQQQQQQRDQQLQQQRSAFEQQRNAKNQARNGEMPGQKLPPGHGLSRIQNPIKTPDFDRKTRRPNRVPPFTNQPIPLQKALPMPNFTSHASPDQLNQARLAQENMLKHLRAIPLSQAPQNYARLRSRQLQSYYNNYPFWVNNRRYYVNRQNTSYYRVPPNYYPNWYQPNPNWVFSNGFSLANAVQVGIDWLGFGWQPYYGAPPTGFICARDYIPTPWLYDVATGQWRQPGLYSYMSEGPDYDYTGPITVEVIEQVFAPNGQIVNVPYLYNAFYYPDQGRWAYENRQGYFIWLDV